MIRFVGAATHSVDLGSSAAIYRPAGPPGEDGGAGVRQPEPEGGEAAAATGRPGRLQV